MSNLWTLRNEKISTDVTYLPAIAVTSHPLSNNGKLQQLGSNSGKKKLSKLDFRDPLSIAFDGADPLTLVFPENDPLSQAKLLDTEDLPTEATNFKSWNEICSQYLAKCSTTQRLSLASNFPLNSELGAPNFEVLGYNKVKGSTQTESERIRLRLDYLTAMDDSNSSRDLTNLTQDQFSEYISFLKSEMLNVWKSEYRVKALKIAKESAKSLVLSTPELFYPHKFMLVTDLLSTLGRLVHQRLSELQATQSNPMEVAEIAKNWFSNISSVRHLLPRIYLEAALLQCYVFSDFDTVENVFKRVLQMTRGIADPLVSTYAKMYVVKSAIEGSHVVHTWPTAICDIRDSLQWGWSEQGIESIALGKEGCLHGTEIAEKIFYPPLLWLLQCLVKYSFTNSFQVVLEICSRSEKFVQYIFLKATLATFPQSFIASECIVFSGLVSQCLQYGKNPQDLLVSYGKTIVLAPPLKSLKFELMTGIWNLLCTLSSQDVFIKACNPWIQFAVQNFDVNDSDKILANLVKKLKSLSETQPRPYHSELRHLVVNVLRNATHPELLLLRPNLQQLLTMLQREGVGSRAVGKDGKTKLGLSELKELLETVISHHNSPLKEPSLIIILIDLFSSLHDRINALTTSDEKRQITQLLRDFILKVDFGKDFTQQLEFYVSCRASFVNLSSILETLIHQVCKLQMETLLIVKRKHTSKTASFERACTAYCFITIPSLTVPHKRLQLFLLVGSVAMVNSCVSQAQACIESSIEEVSKCAELLAHQMGTASTSVSSAVLCLCSYLIATPCLSESSLRWFASVTKAIQTITNNVDLVAKLKVAVFKAVCTSSRKSLPYHFNGVTGNDSIFSFERRHQEANDICRTQLSTVLNIVTTSNSDTYNNPKTDLLECLLQYGDHKENTRAVIVLVLKSLTKQSDKVYFERKIKRLMQL